MAHPDCAKCGTEEAVVTCESGLRQLSILSSFYQPEPLFRRLVFKNQSVASPNTPSILLSTFLLFFLHGPGFFCYGSNSDC